MDEQRDERRKLPRHRTLKSARIVFGNLSQVFDCIIRNASDEGVLLKVSDTLAIPEEFLLYIDADHIRRPARAVWRTEDQIGVRFTGPAESTLKKGG
ncbi:PilZ domain-containing protein [Polymorphum gilvum]|uniref:Type IV pilus assembly PilZ n=1 Tax=Polymorphum gilvum (strain LMG 25793 / CGMCC 1.9160 / SL003B-26A1) TaxID=991905 RepID=F2J1P5_POLGS|nr:PilZ domain-containing protein [Polymorphum gilvum]ADZ70846.1 Type IV pilus assembly PilZ [Polymorphum gilvum SL003B-26A1]